MRNKGITLIALVITIIVLLILAGVTLATLTGENGIITRANEAKIRTALGALKEEVDIKTVEYNLTNDRELLLEDLYADGKVERTVRVDGENYYLSYIIEEGQWESTKNIGEGNPSSGKDIFIIDENLRIKYIASNGKEYGEEIEEKLLEDTTIIKFRSPEFAEYVKKISGATSVDEIQFQWMKNQTELTIDDSSITNLQDLVFFPNVTKMILSNLTLEDLEGVQYCSKLQSFNAYSSSIKDFNKLSELPYLKVFYILYGKDFDFDNAIDSLKTVDTLTEFILNSTRVENKSMPRISELSDNLTSIYLRNTGNIEKIEGLETKTNLTLLDLQGNKITKIEGLENCTKLKNIDLSNNKITKIEGLENLTELEELGIGNNQLTDILELDKNTKLINLGIINNPNIKASRNDYTEEENKRLDIIQEIITVRNGKININPEQLQLFKGYKTLELFAQNLTTLEYLEGQTELETLNLRRNKITLADEKSQEILKSMTKLKRLDLSENPIETLSPINELENLNSLVLIGIPNVLDLTEIEDVISQITFDGLKKEDINSIVNCDSEKITKISVSQGGFTKLPDLSKFSNLKTIYIGSVELEDIEIISDLTNLEEIELYKDNLTGKIPDLSKLVNLKSIKLQSNYLNSGDLAELSVLKNNTNLTIDLRNNSIIDASSLLELDTSCKIYLGGNVNLSQQSKDALKARFGSNVTF